MYVRSRATCVRRADSCVRAREICRGPAHKFLRRLSNCAAARLSPRGRYLFAADEARATPAAGLLRRRTAAAFRLRGIFIGGAAIAARRGWPLSGGIGRARPIRLAGWGRGGEPNFGEVAVSSEER